MMAWAWAQFLGPTDGPGSGLGFLRRALVGPARREGWPGMLGSLHHDVELNQEVCKGKEIAYFLKIYPIEASPSWVMAMVG